MQIGPRMGKAEPDKCWVLGLLLSRKTLHEDVELWAVCIAPAFNQCTNNRTAVFI